MTSYDNLKGAALAELLEKGSMDVMRWEDDDLAMRWAASSSNLQCDKLSPQEAGCFPDVLENTSSIQLYLYIRNKILQMWSLEPNVELTIEDVYKDIAPPFNSDKVLIMRIHGYLQRYGHINFGSFHKIKGPPSLVSSHRKKVIIIGAGAAGIAAAKQLLFFGFEVVVIEARNRVGGRCHTVEYHLDRSNQTLTADTGAATISGLQGNPLVVILKQLQLTPMRLDMHCPIYDEAGKPLDARKDKLVEEAFQRVGQANAYITKKLGVESVEKGKKMNLQKSYDCLLNLLEYRMGRRRGQFWESYRQVLKKMQQLQSELFIYARAIESLGAEVEAQAEQGEENMPEEGLEKLHLQVVHRCQQRDLVEAFRRYHAANDRLRGLCVMLKDLRKQEPSEVYMNLRDRRILDFHMANVEFATGTSLSNLSARHWDHNAKSKNRSSQMLIREGLGVLMTKLAEGLEPVTRMNTVVDVIEYDKNGVTVSYSHDGMTNVERADAVIVTVPLGVLKRSVEIEEKSSQEQLKDPVLRFSPPLPEKHINAIRRMGNGSLNKVIMFFERAFWTSEQNFFGQLKPHRGARGELFLFVVSPGKPILTVIMAGHAANQDMDKTILVRNAMRTLQNIFGVGIPKGPEEAVVTAWHRDAFSYGCFSYVAVDCDGSEIDDLTETVRALDETSGERTGPERVFLAGEHTHKGMAATVQGAWLSGVREAAKVADSLMGCPFARGQKGEEETECVLLDSDEDEEPAASSSITVANGTTAHGAAQPESNDVVLPSDVIAVEDDDDDVMLID